MQVDPNTGVQMYESDDIISYLFEKCAALPAWQPPPCSPCSTSRVVALLSDRCRLLSDQGRLLSDQGRRVPAAALVARHHI